MKRQIQLVAVFAVGHLLSLNFAEAFVNPVSKLFPRKKETHASTRILASYKSYDTSENIPEILWGMARFFCSMKDPSTHRFYYLCFPQSGERSFEHFPIRDLGATWDATTALLFWNEPANQEWLQSRSETKKLPDDWERLLHTAVQSTMEAYNTHWMNVYLQNPAAGIAISSEVLQERPNIAHSAFLLLVCANAMRLAGFHRPHTDYANHQDLIPLDDLTRGILSMQREEDGAFCIAFGGGTGDSNVYSGIDFFPGEAMVALMDVYELTATPDGSSVLSESTRQAILPSMLRAFDFYSNYYHHGEVDVNYNIWQVQAFARLYHALKNDASAAHCIQPTQVAAYVLEMCNDIISSRSWKELARGKSFYPNLHTVEIACGLDAIAQGLGIATEEGKDELQAKMLSINADNAVTFLKFMQDLLPEDQIGSGGLGYGGVQVFEQRLDVTGHALSALTKLHQLEAKQNAQNNPS